MMATRYRIPPASRTADVPFLPPLDPKPIVLDLPVPPSVNRTRKVDWRARSATARWHAQADALVMAQGRLRRQSLDRGKCPSQCPKVFGE